MLQNPHQFDREVVTRRVESRVNELWREMVTISGQLWDDTCPNQFSRKDAIRAAAELRGALLQVMPKIGGICGTAGELLKPEHYVALAEQFFRESVIPECERSNCPPKNVVAPGADPNWLMVQDAVSLWKDVFFGPQKGNSEKMVAGLIASAKFNKEAARPAHVLLDRLRSSTLKRYDRGTPDLLGKIIEFLQVYMPVAEPDSQSRSGKPFDPDELMHVQLRANAVGNSPGAPNKGDSVPLPDKWFQDEDGTYLTARILTDRLSIPDSRLKNWRESGCPDLDGEKLVAKKVPGIGWVYFRLHINQIANRRDDREKIDEKLEIEKRLAAAETMTREQLVGRIKNSR